MEFLEIAFKILIAILVFSVIIVIHEAGHFIAARLSGIKINEFAIGMGPKILKFQGKETLYSLRLFPIGGFCAMEGEDEESGDDKAFYKKPVWKRIIVVIAGAFMNILLGFIILICLTSQEKLIGINKVSNFTENATSNSTNGLKVNDEILKVNGDNIFVNYDIMFSILRDRGKTDKQNTDGLVDFTVKRDNEIVELKDVPFEIQESEGNKFVNIDFQQFGETNNFFLTLKESSMKTVSLVRQVWVSFLDLITGHVPMKQLSGPVGVTEVITNVVSFDLTPLLTIIAFITINIGVFNLLPLPALDGGRLIFLIIEAIRRKPVNPKYEGYVHAAGLALFMLLILVVTFNDIIKLIS